MRETETETDSCLPPVGLLSKSWSLELLPNLPNGCRIPGSRTIFHCFSRHIARELDIEVELLGHELIDHLNLLITPSNGHSG